MCAELEVDEILTDILSQLQMVLDEWYGGRQQTADMGADQVGQRQHSQQEEVACQQQVDVLLAEELSGDVGVRTVLEYLSE